MARLPPARQGRDPTIHVAGGRPRPYRHPSRPPRQRVPPVPLRVVPQRDRKLNRLVKAAEAIPLRRGDTLWKRGDASEALVLVRRGHLRLEVPGGPGSPGRAAQVVGPWEMAGEEALVAASRRHRTVAGEEALLAAARRYTAVAGEAGAVQWLDPREVTSVLTTSRVTREAFLAAWMDDLQALGHLTAGSGHPDAAGRLASVLLHLAARLGRGAKTPATIPLRLTHRTLADLAGLHRTTVTTLLNDWLYRGWIADTDPGLRIEEPDRLRRSAGIPDEAGGASR